MLLGIRSALGQWRGGCGGRDGFGRGGRDAGFLSAPRTHLPWLVVAGSHRPNLLISTSLLTHCTRVYIYTLGHTHTTTLRALGVGDGRGMISPPSPFWREGGAGVLGGGSNLLKVVTLPCPSTACLTYHLLLMQHNIHLPGTGSEGGIGRLPLDLFSPVLMHPTTLRPALSHSGD